MLHKSGCSTDRGSALSGNSRYICENHGEQEKYSRNNKRGRGNFNPKNGFGSKFEPNHRQRGRGIARRGMGYGRRQSSPDFPPKEAFVGFSDKDMDEIYLNTGENKPTDAYHDTQPSLPIPQQQDMQSFPGGLQMLENYHSDAPVHGIVNSSTPTIAVPQIDYLVKSPPDFSETISSLLRKDQFLDAAKAFEDWCLEGKCDSSNFNCLLNILSTVSEFLEKLMEAGHSLQDFIATNKKEVDYRSLFLKEKCHAIESIFISCKVEKARSSFSNYQNEDIESLCQKAFKGISLLKEILNLQDKKTGKDGISGYYGDKDKLVISDSRNVINSLPEDMFETSLCSILSIALNTYPYGASVNDLVIYCARNKIDVSETVIECILRKNSHLFVQSSTDFDKWSFNGFSFLNKISKKEFYGNNASSCKLESW